MSPASNEEQAIREQFLFTLLELGGTGDPIQVLVECWKKLPHLFGLAGFRTEHPDARLLDTVGGVRSAWLEDNGEEWTLTEEGRRVIADLKAGVPLPLPLKPTTEEMYQDLLKKIPVRRRHPWEEYAELLQEGGISSATRYGFTVELGDGSRDVHFREGLTPKHYEYFEPFLDDDLAKGTLIKGVLAAMLPTLSWLDFDEAWRRIGQRHASDPEEIEEEWLPGLVDRLGFERVAEQVAEAAREYRETPTPKPKSQPTQEDPVARLLPPVRQARFVFRDAGPLGWLIRFTCADGSVEQGVIPDSKPIQYCRTILERAPQQVKWEELWSDPEAVEGVRELLEVESQFSKQSPFDDEKAYLEAKEQLPRMRDTMEHLAQTGEMARAETMRELLALLEQDIKNHEFLKRKPGNAAREKIGKFVRRYLDRANETLDRKGLPGLAKHLANAIRREYTGAAYLPAGEAPTWTF